MARDGYFADGKLLYDIDEDALTVIKSWEDVGYIELIVEVITADGKTEATAFVWQEEITRLTAWNRNEFQKLHLEDYANIHIPKYLEGYRKSQE